MNDLTPDCPPEIRHDWELENLVLDCGHPPSEHSEITTGYATTADGKRLCYDCANERERACLAASGKYTAYLSSDGNFVTTWTGGELATIISMWTTNHQCFGRLRRAKKGWIKR